jgi:hypothetical protein
LSYFYCKELSFIVKIYFRKLSTIALRISLWRERVPERVTFSCTGIRRWAYSRETGSPDFLFDEVFRRHYYKFYSIMPLERNLDKRFLSLLPCGAVLLIWALGYKFFGFGTYGSGAYIEPLGNPIEFFRTFILRSPLLLMGQWSPFPADTGAFFSEKVAHYLSLTLLVMLFFILIPLIRRNRTARFWSLGMVLSLIPVSASLPSNRLLLFVGLGAMGLLAQFLSGLMETSGNLSLSRVWRTPASVIGVIFVIFHLVISPLSMPPFAYSIKWVGDFFTAPVKFVPNDPQIVYQDLILVNPPNYLFSVNLIKPLKLMEGKPVPRYIRALAVGPVQTTIQRIDRESLKVSIPEGLFNGLTGHLFRSSASPLIAGQEFYISGLSIKIIRSDKGRGPEEMIYRFDLPLEDPSLRWLRWEKGTYVTFSPPPLGQSITVQGDKAYDVFRMVKSR